MIDWIKRFVSEYRRLILILLLVYVALTIVLILLSWGSGERPFDYHVF